MDLKTQAVSVGVNHSASYSVTFRFARSRDMSRAFSDLPRAAKDGTAVYARFGHPSMWALASKVALLERGVHAECYATGMGALQALLHAIVSPGDLVVASSRLYSGTMNALKTWRDHFGVDVRFVDITDLSAVEDLCELGARLLLAETVSNPTCIVADISGVVAIAKRHGVWTAFDNTFAPGAIAPLLHGADIVWHSLTKYWSAHSDCMAGAVVLGADAASRFSPDLLKASIELGATMYAPLADLLSDRFHDMPSRFETNSRVAMRLAEGFAALGVPVMYPGLPGTGRYVTFRKICSPTFQGYGGVLSIDFGSASRAHDFVDALTASSQAMCAVSLGSNHTYVCVPYDTMAPFVADPAAPEVGPGIVRISAGDGEPDDVWNSFANAYASAH